MTFGSVYQKHSKAGLLHQNFIGIRMGYQVCKDEAFNSLCPAMSILMRLHRFEGQLDLPAKAEVIRATKAVCAPIA